MTTETFTNLYNAYYYPLCLYALHYTREYPISQDIVQDSFITLWEKYSDLLTEDIHGELKALIYTLVKNRSIDYLRQSDYILTDPLVLSTTVPEESEIVQSHSRSGIWTTIKGLPKQRKQAFLLNKRDGLSYREIAERLGVSMLTVKNHIRLAVKELRKETYL